ncbi:radical SAM protein [Poseidonibacter ostreae]|uniref:Radical SAM protein n=1 Tax=Poseidonibacter ostreae TaxID=2654171 RepID=A0A6L4WTY5_9BACT|nr:radical SAM protein [Poseidonibacter ostreae]KAB7888865.1 radical SAM protein [Poseidonibacter ostreae]KAB7889644.1 radical SAM protein [Poseidonibacter ostreae]
MKFTGITYRPPPESNTMLLQVTAGCAHNNCTYCSMYTNVKFKVENIEQIEKDLQEAKRIYEAQKRIFLVNGDAFVLSAKKLKIISNKILEYFPMMETISMYSSIRNIMTKTDEELKELREDYKINDLWVGVETGDADILKSFNKGYTMDDTYTQLHRLNKVGIDYNCKLMLGTGGTGKGIEVAKKTAKLINETKPKMVRETTLGFFEGTQLLSDVDNGVFTPASELEILEEQKKLIELIDVEDIHFASNHHINAVSVQGYLPIQRQRMIDSIDYFINISDKSFLNSVSKRQSV